MFYFSSVAGYLITLAADTQTHGESLNVSIIFLNSSILLRTLEYKTSSLKMGQGGASF